MSWEKFLDDTSASFEKLAKETPDTFRGFGIMGKPAKTSGKLNEKMKEFIALGIAIATRCESCIGFHTRSLVRLGATREEFVEALSVASYMGGGPSISFSSKALNAFDEFSKKG